jgi:hypothetical protein
MGNKKHSTPGSPFTERKWIEETVGFWRTGESDGDGGNTGGKVMCSSAKGST